MIDVVDELATDVLVDAVTYGFICVGVQHHARSLSE